MMSPLRILFVSLVWLLCLPADAGAQTINVTLTPNAVAGVAGSGFTIQSTLSNTSGTGAFINGAVANIPGLGITLDATPFLVSAPATLASPGAAGPFDALNITITGAATPGVYVGTFTILGGTDGGQLNDIGSATFTVTVLGPGGGGSSVPEGDGLTLLLAAAPVLGLLQLRRRPGEPPVSVDAPHPPDAPPRGEWKAPELEAVAAGPEG